MTRAQTLSQAAPLLKVENLCVNFTLGKGRVLPAASEVSFSIRKGETMGLVGESGSGKSTVANAVGGLLKPSSGRLQLGDLDLRSQNSQDLKAMRQRVQFIFQDPYSSLNPRWRAEDIVLEALQLGRREKQTQKIQDKLDSLFADVGLIKEQRFLFPHQFSGGQRQRIGIARAIAPEPELIICDEPVSALDVAIQAQILNKLSLLQEKLQLTSLFISHDLGVVRYMCDSIAVMYMGKIVEYATSDEFFVNPVHPYSRVLLSAVQHSADGTTKRIRVSSERPHMPPVPPGCLFASRCPAATDLCRQQPPRLQTREGSTHQVACHLVDQSWQSPI